MSWHYMELVLSEVVCFLLNDKTEAQVTDLVVELHPPHMNCSERTSNCPQCCFYLNHVPV